MTKAKNKAITANDKCFQLFNTGETVKRNII